MLNFVRSVSVTGLIARILLINGVVCLAQEQTTAEVGDSFLSAPPKTILIHHVERSTSSITLNWTSNFSLSSYQVRARSLLSGITLTGQPTNETEYTLTDLMIDTPYDICVTAKVTEAQVTGSKSDDERNERPVVETCLQLRTIPLIRVDTVLVLLGVILFIVLSVAAALVCWKCSQNNDTGASADATISDYKDDANEVDSAVPEMVVRKNPDEAARPLLQAAGKTDKVKHQQEVENAQGPQTSNNLQSNELSSELNSDRPTQV